ncbi:molybdate ABC transporter substrate-binding protein [Aestuariirhabdus sp. LZHN29]|uniref:molybdate ABC transporter substrate-binding protein n=1 Tax=Aestuariirhabdus sp. LZHN29 TaxID=3417462 RepID=UPI003CF010F5
MGLRLSILWALLLVPATPLVAAEVRVAVASNFMVAARALAADFERRSGHRLRISSGSTGKLYTQIYHGAPYDLFLAADAERPMRAEREGLAVTGTRFTYATGRLALWSPQGDPLNRLQQGDFRRLAIANPNTAPYGAAASEVLAQLHGDATRNKLVYGENISQTHQFVASGNADLGFVSLSQLQQEEGGNLWLVPQHHYRPIQQQVVLLKGAISFQPARDFLAYLQGESAGAIIAAGGYYGPGGS